MCQFPWTDVHGEQWGLATAEDQSSLVSTSWRRVVGRALDAPLLVPGDYDLDGLNDFLVLLAPRNATSYALPLLGSALRCLLEASRCQSGTR